MNKLISLAAVVVAAGAFFLVYPHLAGQQAPAGDAAPSAQRPSGQAGGNSQQGKRGGGAAAVVTAVAVQRTVPILKSAVGFIEASEVVVVRPRVDGLVLQTNVVAGQEVKKGDVLFQLDPGPIGAVIDKDTAQLAKDQTAADLASTELKRAQALLAKGVDNQDQVDTADSAARAATASIAIDQAQIDADQLAKSYLTITAPIDGRVGVVNTSNGNLVRASDSSAGGLLTITRMDALRVSFAVPESDLDTYRMALASGTPPVVTIVVPGDQTPRSTGKLTFLDSSVDTGSGTVMAKADVDDAKGQLWPGQYVSVTVEAGSYSNATTIPAVGVQQSSNGPFVFAVGPDGKIKKTPVSVVATVGDTAIVGPELQPGAHVVVEGTAGPQRRGVGTRNAAAGRERDAGSGRRHDTGTRRCCDGGTEPRRVATQGRWQHPATARRPPATDPSDQQAKRTRPFHPERTR